VDQAARGAFFFPPMTLEMERHLQAVAGRSSRKEASPARQGQDLLALLMATCPGLARN
jgi:hypothetical protein